MEIKRRKTKVVKIGQVKIGGNNPISIQSMAKTKTANIKTTVNQIINLENIGCQIIRVAVKDEADARAISEIKKKIKIPLEADIHFNYQLALLAIKSGSDAIRLNPGNIYRVEEIEEVVASAKKAKIPIRVGVNSGSLRLALGTRHQAPSTKMVGSVLEYIRILEKLKFHAIMVSLKASDVMTTVEAYRKMAGLCDYPFHLGITATGLPFEGGIKSAVGLGILLSEGIGDTIRVSLSGDPKDEIKVGQWILSGLGLRQFGPQIIACPTCGRSQIDVIKIAHELEEKLLATCYPPLARLAFGGSLLATPSIKVAIMGCEVNGPGEAADADVGIAGGKNCGVLFKKGKIVKRIKEEDIVERLLKEIESAN